ncbi:hypothetical protein WIW50_04655 [Flavobacteriaceae bacterium 3-367]
MKHNLVLLFSILISSLIYSQTEYVEKYDGGQIKVKGFVVDSILTGNYMEYYKNGQIKSQGELKNCEYETNHTKIYMASCGVGNNLNIRKGKKHGLWTDYYENGVLKSNYNYYCGLRQGNFFYYYESGNLESIDFYSADKQMGTQEFHKNGVLSLTATYSYEYSEHDGHDLKSTMESEYYEDGSLRIQRTVQELKDDVEKERFKEYYPNGFLKTETEMVDLDKNGIHREFYENGNTKYEGIFKDDKPIDKQYYYNTKGEITKIEIWKNGKIADTELKKTSG